MLFFLFFHWFQIKLTKRHDIYLLKMRNGLQWSYSLLKVNLPEYRWQHACTSSQQPQNSIQLLPAVWPLRAATWNTHPHLRMLITTDEIMHCIFSAKNSSFFLLKVNRILNGPPLLLWGCVCQSASIQAGCFNSINKRGDDNLKSLIFVLNVHPKRKCSSY